MQDEIIMIALTAVVALGAVISVILMIWRWVFNKHVHQVRFVDVPLPEVGPFDGRGAVCSCEHSCQLHLQRPESVVVGSNFTRVSCQKIPRTQIAVYSVNENGRLIKYLGVATRVLDWLVVPHHVIVSEDVIALLSMKTDPPTSFKMATEKFELIEGDLAAVRVSESDFSQLGLTKAGIATVDGESMVSICSASKEPEMSFGIMSHDQKVFGGVVFHGSTKGGFSGAPYMLGKQIAGIHLGGGVMNYGVSASYVVALLQKQEDTAEWLQKVRRKKGPVKYQRSKFNPDEAIVFVDGRYHTVDLSLLEMDEEEPAGDVYMPVRELEVNLHENFPPQYVDTVKPIVEGVNTITQEIQTKNAEVAEQCSAETAEEYLERHAKLMSQLDEKIMLLQTLQDGVSNRYRELQRLLTEMPSKDEGRAVVVKENEQLKHELSMIKRLKTDVNVEASLAKAIPKSVRKAKAKGHRASILDKITAEGIVLDDVIQGLVDKGLVVRAAQPVGNVATTSASEGGLQKKN